MIANNITELIGKTPMVKLKIRENIIAKLEYFNPGCSVKDRIALSMIEDAENKGVLNTNTTIIEPTSGNTGIGLAMICAAKGYKLKIVMPESMSIERRKIIQGFGAEIILTEASKGMNGAIEKTKELLQQIPNSITLMQFANPANPEAHRKTTALEIWNDCNGKIDIFVAGVGTGGSITGIGEVLKQMNPAIKIIAVEPLNSNVLSGGKHSPHKIQGIGAGFIPEMLNTKIYDEIITVSNEDAIESAKYLISKEGLMVGISTGANFYAAKQMSERNENNDKTIVFIACDTAERYLSTDLYNF